MKTISRRIQFFVVIGMLIHTNNLACAAYTSVIGSGFVDLNDDIGLDINFRVTVAAYEFHGYATGLVISNVDLTGLGIGTFSTIERVVNLQRDGNTAWVCAERLFTTNSDVAPVGSHSVTMIVDLGGPGVDIMHQESIEGLDDFVRNNPKHPDVPLYDTDGDGDVDCDDRPLLFPSIVDQGNYRIRPKR